jgi:GTPase SAR1 family protein
MNWQVLMAIKLRRPILIGGLSLTVGIWLWDSVTPSVLDVSGTVVWGAIALGTGVWWLKRQAASIDPEQTCKPMELDRSAVDRAIAQVEARLQQFKAEAPDDSVTALKFQAQLTTLKDSLNRHELRVQVIGGPSVGKTAIVKRLTQEWLPSASKVLSHHVSLGDAQGVLDDQTMDTDLILFVVSGDLTDPEFQWLQRLRDRQQRILVVFNKQDQYLPSERPVILQQIRARLQGCIPSQDIVAISIAPAPVKVRQHRADGSTQEWLEQSAADFIALTERLEQILAQQGQHLILATTFRQASGLQDMIQTRLNQIRRNQALSMIEQYQWIAATAAFANPVPSLDLLATAAINTQLVVDLASLYHQKFSLNHAKNAAGNLASLMVKLGLVELSTQAISPLLKSNALTYVAGGLLQGVSAAYLTRIAGLSLIEYFEEQGPQTDGASPSPLRLDRLAAILKSVFQHNQRTAFLQTLVKQAVNQLSPSSLPPSARSGKSSALPISQPALEAKPEVLIETS